MRGIGLGSMPIITSEHLVRSAPCDLTRWQVFRCWLEGLADGADLIWPWARVQRSRLIPIPELLVIGGVGYCHPAVFDQIRRTV